MQVLATFFSTARRQEFKSNQHWSSGESGAARFFLERLFRRDGPRGEMFCQCFVGGFDVRHHPTAQSLN